jgi:hypothetical protein
MLRPFVPRLWWLVPAAAFAGILFLEARIDNPTLTTRDSSLTTRLIALVSCVLPASADDPSAPSDGVSETPAIDCDTPMLDHGRTAWVTAC